MKQELSEKVEKQLPDRANDHKELVIETIHKLREISCAGNDMPDHVNDAAEAKLVVILTDLIDSVEANALKAAYEKGSENGEGLTGQLASEQLTGDASGQTAEVVQTPNFQPAV